MNVKSLVYQVTVQHLIILRQKNITCDMEKMQALKQACFSLHGSDSQCTVIQSLLNVVVIASFYMEIGGYGLI